MGKASTQNKNRTKAYNEYRAGRRRQLNTQYSENSKVKHEFEIAKLKSQIKIVEYDLQHNFKNNEIIKHKLTDLKVKLKTYENQNEC